MSSTSIHGTLVKEATAVAALRDKFINEVLSQEEKFWENNLQLIYGVCGLVQDGRWCLTKRGIGLVDVDNPNEIVPWAELSARHKVEFILNHRKGLLGKIRRQFDLLSVQYTKAIQEEQYRTTQPK